MNVKKLWVSFRHNGKELCRISVIGMSIGEAEETKKLLAYEKNVPEEEIEVAFWVEG